MSYETWCMIYSAQYDFKAVQNVLGTHSQVTSKWKKNIGCAPHCCDTTFNFSFSLQNVSGKSVDGPGFLPLTKPSSWLRFGTLSPAMMQVRRKRIWFMAGSM